MLNNFVNYFVLSFIICKKMCKFITFFKNILFYTVRNKLYCLTLEILFAIINSRGWKDGNKLK